jgi:hypothetical protein
MRPIRNLAYEFETSYPPLDHLHTALKPAIEVTLSTTSSKDLSFDDELVGPKALCYIVSFLWCLCSFAFGCKYAILFDSRSQPQRFQVLDKQDSDAPRSADRQTGIRESRGFGLVAVQYSARFVQHRLSASGRTGRPGQRGSSSQLRAASAPL